MAADEAYAVRPVTPAPAAAAAAAAPIRARRWRRWLVRLVLAGVVVFALLQLVPYGRDHDNPPVAAGAQWPSASSERLARAACYDCHSDETEWPWYSNVAPMSWLVQRDVDRGRAAVNFSEWMSEAAAGDGVDDLHDAVEDGSMPPWQYTLNHPAARLSAAERAELVEALRTIEDEIEDDRSGSDRGRGRSGGGG